MRKNFMKLKLIFCSLLLSIFIMLSSCILTFGGDCITLKNSTDSEITVKFENKEISLAIGEEKICKLVILNYEGENYTFEIFSNDEKYNVYGYEYLFSDFFIEFLIKDESLAANVTYNLDSEKSMTECLVVKKSN